MEHKIEHTRDGLRITASVDPDRQVALLGKSAKCAAGTCSCPSPQYGKLQSIAVSAQAACVRVDLKAKPGQVIEIADIERCLQHTAQQAGD